MSAALLTRRPGDSPSWGLGGALDLSLIGAVLILVESVALILAGAFYQVPVLGFLSTSFVVVGAFGVALAVLIAVLAVLLYLLPRQHLVLGVALLSLSVLSLDAGGGAFLGFLLCYVGSLIAIFARPPSGVRTMSPELAAAAENDPVVEADLVDRGYAPSPSPAPGPRAP